MKTIIIAALAALIIAGCGGTSKTSTVATKPHPKPKTYSALDYSTMSQAQHEIKAQLRDRIEPQPNMRITSTVVHCVGESERTFSCNSETSLKFTEGGYTMCGSIHGDYKGTVDPHKGITDWKNAGTTSDDPYDC